LFARSATNTLVAIDLEKAARVRFDRQDFQKGKLRESRRIRTE
jgi:hypothetical protein